MKASALAHEGVATVAKDNRFSRDILPLVRWLPRLVRLPLTRQMLSQDPPDHTRWRKLVSQAAGDEVSSAATSIVASAIDMGRSCSVVMNVYKSLQAATTGQRCGSVERLKAV